MFKLFMVMKFKEQIPHLIYIYIYMLYLCINLFMYACIDYKTRIYTYFTQILSYKRENSLKIVLIFFMITG